MIIDEDDHHLIHYGVLRRSGRYPWGSGGPEYASTEGFLGRVEQLHKQGLTQTEIARGMGITTTELRAAKTIALAEMKEAKYREAMRLKEKGYSTTAIGEKMGINESSVRSLLAPGQKAKNEVLMSTANMLREQVDKKDYIDIGTGSEMLIGVTSTKMKAAVALLQEEGYTIHYVKVMQLGTGKETTVKVLARPDTPWTEVNKNRERIVPPGERTVDGGQTFQKLRPPISLDSKRVGIRYAEDGGTEADGTIYIRPGAKDLDLGGSRYAQVRIAVDNSHYLKGMAVYRDDLPDGVDVVFNTNKKDTGDKLDALKPMQKDANGKIDINNPFGASIKPGGQRGAFNIVNEEGDWDKWSSNLSSQVLSKQAPALARKQLDMTYERRRNDLDGILELTNPAVKRKLLEGFSDDADAASVHLKAAALPRQATKVLLPARSVKETEIYAPGFIDGERVALVRFPHGGRFEIPELVVNNKNAESRRMLGTNTRDAVAVNSKVAERLSGADFDGDTVLVIPNDRGSIKTAPALADLKGFDHQAMYKIPKDSPIPRMTAEQKGLQMGQITNLIADMTIRGAGPSDLARAVKHSMVVIDAEKHGLDYKASARDNGIAALKQKYQGSSKAGASTLITRATSEVRVLDRKAGTKAVGGPIDKATGKRNYEYTGKTYVDRKGEEQLSTFKSKQLAEVDDAYKLFKDGESPTPIERVYADHSNRLKGLANQARKEMVNTPSRPMSRSAKAAYSTEVASLNEQLNRALRNRPLERQAQLVANATVSLKRQANPNLDKDDLKKINSQALAEARVRTGAKKAQIVFSEREWQAIQAGAISDNKLVQMLNNADLDRVRELATPRKATVMTDSKKQRARQMLANGYTQADVARQLGVPLSTLNSSMDE